MEAFTATAQARVLDILRLGQEMTLATIRPDGYPQATTVSYVNDDLTLYAAIGLGSQKAHNIQHCPRVSATINLDYADWRHIRGVSLGGHARFAHDAEQIGHITRLLLQKFPEARSFVQGTVGLRSEGLLYLCVRPTVISLLDYALGFGHTELYALGAAPASPQAPPD